MTKQKRWHRHQRLRKTRHHTPQRRRQTRQLPRQQRNRHGQPLGHVVYRQTGGNEDSQFDAVGTAETDADPDAFGEGVEGHDEDDEEDSACVGSGEGSDFEVLVFFEEGFGGVDEADAEGYADDGAEMAGYFGDVVWFVEGASF
mmetsp:Transcript_34277/g.41000  ORF Transcript_34277/g.41000 Transcript_34277/m.41000 type:complete len:144 (-) Transcript_34277:435-866(-)